MMLKTGSFYSFFYSHYKTNIKIYAFVLYGGPGSDKVHALNLGAKQLSVVDRAKIMKVIQQLQKVNGSNKYKGTLLYRIFKTYLRYEMSKCYRTYIRQYINYVALINYGLNTAEDFLPIEKMGANNQQMFKMAQNDLIVKNINQMTHRGTQLQDLQSGFATIKPAAQPSVSKPTIIKTQENNNQPTQEQKSAPENTTINKPTIQTPKPDDDIEGYN